MYVVKKIQKENKKKTNKKETNKKKYIKKNKKISANKVQMS